MQIRLKLMGSLRELMPPDGLLTLSDSATVQEVLDTLGIPDQRVQVVSVNNKFEHHRGHQLQADDLVIIMPTVVGG